MGKRATCGAAGVSSAAATQPHTPCEGSNLLHCLGLYSGSEYDGGKLTAIDAGRIRFERGGLTLT